MFVGHYAAAFVARSFVPALPLGAAFVAAQLVDFAWDVFVLTGVERAQIVPGLPSNPLALTFMPYSHSLVAAAVFAGATFAAIKLTRAFGGATRTAAAASAVVASHWGLDALVHRADLPLAGDDTLKVGFALWNQPLIALALELALLLGSLVLYLRATRERARVVLGFGAVLVAVGLAAAFGPIPTTLPAMAASLLAVYTALAAAAAWVSARARR